MTTSVPDTDLLSRQRVLWRIAVAWVALVLLLHPPPASADTWHVDSPQDSPDGSPGDGLCAAFDGSGCTLRAAVDEANYRFGADTIVIDGPCRLSLGPVRITGDSTVLASTGGYPAIDGFDNPTGAVSICIEADHCSLTGLP